jgi:hypothetical protein
MKLVRLHAVALLQDAALPQADRQAVAVHADALADQVAGFLDPGIRAAIQIGLNEHPHRKYRQRIDRLVAGSRHRVPGQRHLGDVELFVDRTQAGFSPGSRIEAGFDTCQFHVALQQRPGPVIVGDAECQLEISFHLSLFFQRGTASGACRCQPYIKSQACYIP